MLLTGLTELLRESAAYRHCLAGLQGDGSSQALNVIRAARPYVLATLAQDWPGPIIYLTARGKRTHNVIEQSPVWLRDSQRLHRFAEPTPMFYDRIAWDKLVIRERIETLQALMYGDSAQQAGTDPVIIASARALMQRSLPVHQFRQRSSTLKPGQRHNFEKLIGEWLNLGYEPASIVTEPGSFSRRGGILDIYPLASEWPVRIDFFDDEIESIKIFDPTTQRSIGPVTSIQIVPAREALPEYMPPVGQHLSPWFTQLSSQVDDELISAIQDADALLSGQSFPYLEHYLPYVHANPVSLLDYAPDDALIVVEEWDELREVVMEWAQDAEANRENNLKTQQIAEDHPIPYVDWEILASDLAARPVLHLNQTGRLPGLDDQDGNPTRIFRPGERFGGQLKPALTQLRNLRNQGERVVIVSEQTERLSELWYEQDSAAFVPIMEEVSEAPAPGSLIFVKGTLGEGWTLEDTGVRLHIISDAELFNWSRPEPRRRQSAGKSSKKAPAANYADWQQGDYVVHVDYGIGRFSGMRQRTVEGTDREYLLVEYDGTDMLFVPIHQADRLTRFVGPDEHPPQMNKLGKTLDWVKAKDKARKAAEEEARELLEIYAARASSPGFAFSPDSAWQHELEASFPYVETEDQLRVLHEIKRDMESTMPMDRLVCGDVGYGKTEVALRAAFKAIVDGKQVAVLVPTTVLANQHYETFSERMKSFPVKVEMISRFRTKQEQSQILGKLANGEVDIIIGTHRLLSDDIILQNLGLIIIDEEQRFGVKHKEHFKRLRAHVDILTLTATPIPRTLYLSLSGVRDISMIQTPPEERLPIITHVGPFDGRLGRQAILRELDRGGQIFVIHNRVKTIENLRDKLEEIVPEASIVVAHGQMSGRQLEGVISDFSRGKYDILLATSIIENGIDMPNVNTLLVDRADWFGMSQLYQLRGRVGRSAQQGYAYFFHAGSKRLTEEARTRLETMAEHTELGAGFQIAVRDLELRGAGDILSMKQTGHVSAVGLQLYTQLLQQAVSRLKGDVDAEELAAYERERIIIDLPIAAYIPSDWIEEMALRLQLYRRIGTVQDMASIEALRDEMRDRFGMLPHAVDGVLYQMQVKLLATPIHATAITKPRGHVLIKLPWLSSVNRAALAEQLGEDIEISRTAVELPADTDIWQLRLLEVLEHLGDLMHQGAGV